MPSGGSRVGAGRKPLGDNKRKQVAFYLNNEEERKMREFLKNLREEQKNKPIE